MQACKQCNQPKPGAVTPTQQGGDGDTGTGRGNKEEPDNPWQAQGPATDRPLRPRACGEWSIFLIAGQVLTSFCSWRIINHIINHHHIKIRRFGFFLT